MFLTHIWSYWWQPEPTCSFHYCYVPTLSSNAIQLIPGYRAVWHVYILSCYLMNDCEATRSIGCGKDEVSVLQYREWGSNSVYVEFWSRRKRMAQRKCQSRRTTLLHERADCGNKLQRIDIHLRRVCNNWTEMYFLRRRRTIIHRSIDCDEQRRVLHLEAPIKCAKRRRQLSLGHSRLQTGVQTATRTIVSKMDWRRTFQR